MTKSRNRRKDMLEKRRSNAMATWKVPMRYAKVRKLKKNDKDRHGQSEDKP